MTSVLLNTAYLPNISYFYFLLNSQNIYIEACEHYQKQSYRNRCEILSANGKLSLSIPLLHTSDKEVISQKRISYAENWQINHWRTITSAYKNSPYFEYFEDAFKPFYSQRYEYLIHYNSELLKCLLDLLKIKKVIHYTSSFEKETSCLDLREKIHPKLQEQPEGVPDLSYQQVFSDKFGYTPHLSIIDLLFNRGLDTIDLLSNKL